jgi:hypothetical protein
LGDENRASRGLVACFHRVTVATGVAGLALLGLGHAVAGVVAACVPVLLGTVAAVFNLLPRHAVAGRLGSAHIHTVGPTLFIANSALVAVGGHAVAGVVVSAACVPVLLGTFAAVFNFLQRRAVTGRLGSAHIHTVGQTHLIANSALVAVAVWATVRGDWGVLRATYDPNKDHRGPQAAERHE